MYTYGTKWSNNTKVSNGSRLLGLDERDDNTPRKEVSGLRSEETDWKSQKNIV